MGRSRYRMLHGDTSPYFLTCTTTNWIALFGNMEIARIILDSLRFLIDDGRLAIHGYVIMENHIHLIASSENLSEEIKNFKSFTARSIIDHLKAQHNSCILHELSFHRKRHKSDQQYQLWQEGSHPEAIQNQHMLKQKLDYIHYNPVRRGYVNDPAHWPYSSYRDYHRQTGLLPISMITAQSQAAEPQV
ncbi:MAG: transposase [Dehalococcoidia bacterium]